MKKFQCVTAQHKVVVNGKLSHWAYSRKRALRRVDLGRLGRVGAEAGFRESWGKIRVGDS